MGKVERFKQRVSKLRLSMDFTRSYFMVFTLFLILANDYNRPVATYLGVSFEVAWGLLFGVMVVSSVLISRLFVDHFGFYAHNLDTQIALSPYAQGKINPQICFLIQNIHLPTMRAVGCSVEELAVVELALKKKDWRREK